MDTSLNTDTIHGVQPTLIGQYMINTSQAPLRENCGSEGFYLEQPGFSCSVRHTKDAIADVESQLFGLDRRITKHEPERVNLPEMPKHYSDPPAAATLSEMFEPTGTRDKRSCNVLAGVNVNRFETPIHNPQNPSNIVFQEHYRGGFQTRLAEKDCAIQNCGAQLKLAPSYGTRCFK